MDRMLLKNHKKRCLFFYFSHLCSKGSFMLLLWVSSWMFGKQIKAAIPFGMQPYVCLSPNLRLAQLSDMLSKTRLQVSSLVAVDDVDLSQLV